MKPNRLAIFGVALSLLAPVSTQAQSDALPWLPERNPARADDPKKEPSAAGANEERPTEEEPTFPRDVPTVAWTDSEVAAARADCARALAAVKLDYESLPPIKEGLCGAPAPILIRSIGSDPQVAIDPPATVTCPLAAALDRWIKDKVQPEAQGGFGAPVVKLHNAASYTCRNRYGSANAPLSEHALANAIDISEFVLASGEHVTVLDSWPRVAASLPPPPVPNPTRLAEATGAIVPPPPVMPVSHTRSIGGNMVEVAKASSNPFLSRAPDAAQPQASAANAIAVKKAKANPFVAATPAPKPSASHAIKVTKVKVEAIAPPVPPPVAEPPPPKSLAERKNAFVRKVHDDACKAFGTTLGPEANEAHKNHFHFDMKKRRSGFCE